MVIAATGCSAGEQASQKPAPALSMADVAARAAHTSTTLHDGRVLVVGGCVTDGCTIATADTVLIGADGHNAVAGPPLDAPRTSHTATAVKDGRVLIIGGFLGEGAGVTGSIEAFDPAEGNLSVIGSLAQSRGGHAVALLPGGEILVVGGWIGPGTYTDIVEIVDQAGTVERAQPLPWAADALEATSLVDGRVLVTGGQHARGTATSNAAIYDPASDRWTIVEPMDSARLKHFAVLLSDGRVLVGGGTPDDEILLATTEVFDPMTERFSPGPGMLEPRYKLPGGVVALPGSRALVAGGGSSAEIVDVPGWSSEQIARYDEQASFATVNLLEADDALILGGYNSQIQLTGLARTIRSTW